MKQETDIFGCPITWHDRVMNFLEDWIVPLFAGLALAAMVAVGVGCSTASPERQAHRAVGTTIATANAAMDVWFTYVQQEENNLSQLKKADPAEFMARRRALIIAEGKVATAWDTYVKSQRALILGAAALGPAESPTSADTERLKAEVIKLVQSLIH